ncbi:MAG: hypothetical protein HC905_19575 [Bacteroidales bacterium]|nr:hypothetical protein [Bacteroidales bacterium]
MVFLYTQEFYLLARLWGSFRFDNSGYYPPEFYTLVLPVYLVFWVLSMYFSGSYDTPVRFRNLFSGIVVGTILILIFHALLPSDYRFSRFLILLGALLALLIASFNRIFLSLTKLKQFTLQIHLKRRIAIVGSRNECKRVSNIIEQLKLPVDFTGFVSVEREHAQPFLGTLAQIEEIVNIHKINEIVFCSGDIPASAIITQMLNLAGTGCDYKIAPANSESIIGSNSINTAGDLYVFSLNSVTTAKNIRLKRTFDLMVSLMLICGIPLWLVFVKNPRFLFEKHIQCFVK